MRTHHKTVPALKFKVEPCGLDVRGTVEQLVDGILNRFIHV